MIRSLWTAKTGLEAQQGQLDVIANNLANVSTNGFKRSRAVFEDLVYQNVRQPGAQSSTDTRLPSGLQVGTGVRQVATERLHTQGNLEETSSSKDLAINGLGFFEVDMPDGTTAYTRDGSFQLDANGEMVNANGYKLTAGITIPANATSISISSDGIVSVTQPSSSASTQVGQLNLALFVNNAGLQSIGQNLYQETDASGSPPRPRRPQWRRHGEPGLRGNLQRQRGGGNGRHDPDPARLRNQQQGRRDLRRNAPAPDPALIAMTRPRPMSFRLALLAVALSDVRLRRAGAQAGGARRVHGYTGPARPPGQWFDLPRPLRLATVVRGPPPAHGRRHPDRRAQRAGQCQQDLIVQR
jgi:flagellar basal-body rod protein FlgG, Gram-negative bacteria